jgi:outer membrane protein assembly factor BamD
VTPWLILLATWLTAPASAGQKKELPSTAQELYERGLRHMRHGYFTKALDEFTRVRNYHRDDPLSVTAELAVADVYYKKGDYEQARYSFEEFAAYHPRHEALDYVTWMIGQSIYKRAPKLAGRDQSATRSAVNAWTGFESRFPESEHREKVSRSFGRGRERLAEKELIIARFYEQRQEWGAVAGRCDYLLRRFPDVAQVPEALSLLGQAQHRVGRSAEAQAHLERLRAEFPSHPAVDRLSRVLSQPAGEPPPEEVFFRPYRIRGAPAGPGGMM